MPAPSHRESLAREAADEQVEVGKSRGVECGDVSIGVMRREVATVDSGGDAVDLGEADALVATFTQRDLETTDAGEGGEVPQGDGRVGEGIIGTKTTRRWARTRQMAGCSSTPSCRESRAGAAVALRLPHAHPEASVEEPETASGSPSKTGTAKAVAVQEADLRPVLLAEVAPAIGYVIRPVALAHANNSRRRSRSLSRTATNRGCCSSIARSSSLTIAVTSSSPSATRRSRL